MGYRLSILVFVLAALLVGAICLPVWYFGSRIAVESRFEAKVRRDRAEAMPIELQKEMESAYLRAVADCSQFRGGDLTCPADQFHGIVRWYVLKDQDSHIGPPGIPGPTPFPSDSPQLHKKEGH